MKIQEVVNEAIAQTPDLPRRRPATLWLDEAPYEQIQKCCKLLGTSSSKMFNAFTSSIAKQLEAECLRLGKLPLSE